MGLMLSFFRAYRWQTVLMLVALLLSGIAEGIGLSALLPLLNIALGSEATSMLPSGPAWIKVTLNASYWTHWTALALLRHWAICWPSSWGG